MVITGRFEAREWPDGTVVFDHQSGDTHALDPVVSSIFLSMLGGERNRGDLLRKISSFYIDDSEQGLDARLNEMLMQLDKLGLMKADIN